MEPIPFMLLDPQPVLWGRIAEEPPEREGQPQESNRKKTTVNTPISCHGTRGNSCAAPACPQRALRKETAY